MGSVERFPRARAPFVSLAWRAGPAGTGEATVRQARMADLGSLGALSRHPLREIERRLHACPSGQLVAVRDGRLVGFASALRVEWPGHEGPGDTLHLDEIAVDADRAMPGAARLLVQAQRAICREMNLKRLAATLTLPRDASPPEHYALSVLWGDAADPQWRLLTSQGLQYCGVVRDYPEGSNAALFCWVNPQHTPPGPNATARECA